MSAAMTAGDQLTVQLSIYISTFYPWLSDNIHASSLVSVAPRLYECSKTYSIQGEYEVASSPASEHSLVLYTHDL